MLEHIHEARLDGMLATIRNHIRPDLLFIGTASLVADFDVHITVHPREWWLERFAAHGLAPHPDQDSAIRLLARNHPFNWNAQNTNLFVLQARRRADYMREIREFFHGQARSGDGRHGFVGRNLVPMLERIDCELMTPTRRDYDLLEQEQVRALLADTRPDVVLHLAGLIGGILANKQRPADFCTQNLLMGTLMLHEFWQAGVSKYITLMGGCSYPAHAPSPIRETAVVERLSAAGKRAVFAGESHERGTGRRRIATSMGLTRLCWFPATFTARMTIST